MNVLNQQIQFAESAEDVLRLVADAWRAGGCPDIAFAIESKIQEIDFRIEELKEEHAGETASLEEKVRDLEKEHAVEIEELKDEIESLKNPE